MKDLLRFDTVVAACALLMSTVTAGAMVYQTRVLQDQFSATVWPYLAVEKDYGGNSFGLRLVNEGVGPALIRSAEVSIDGKVTSGWDKEFFATLFGSVQAVRGAGKYLYIQDSSVDSSTAIRAGDALSLIDIKINANKIALIRGALKHRVDLAFCYCSINSKCWTLRASGESNAPTIPQPIGGCRGEHDIAAPISIFRSS